MSDIDTRIDEILKRLCMDYMTNYGSLENDLKLQIQAADHNKYVAKQSIKQLMADEFEKLIGEDEPVDMSFGRTEDQIIRDTCYTQGVNETKAELRQKLKEWKK